MYNLTARQAREFLAESIKHLTVFKNDCEFGWTVVRKDERQMIEIKTNKFNTNNAIKSYPCGSKGDGMACHYYYY